MERTEAKAVAKTIRIAPRKTRLIIDLIRGKSVSEAYAILRNQPQKAARVKGLIPSGLFSFMFAPLSTKSLHVS